MNSAEGLKRLSDLYSNKDWYHSVGLDAYGRYVVYVKLMNHETLYDIPNLNGQQVLVHFAASLPSSVDKFVNRPVLSALCVSSDEVNNFIQKARAAQILGVGVEQLVEQVTKSILEKSNMSLAPTAPQERRKHTSDVATDYLGEYIQKEISQLQAIWGNEAVENVFYEIIDGDDAVTSVSDAHPDLRDRLELLYAQYGFNSICEKLETKK